MFFLGAFRLKNWVFLNVKFHAKQMQTNKQKKNKFKTKRILFRYFCGVILRKYYHI